MTLPLLSVCVNVPLAVTDFGCTEKTPSPVMATRSPFGASDTLGTSMCNWNVADSLFESASAGLAPSMSKLITASKTRIGRLITLPHEALHAESATLCHVSSWLMPTRSRSAKSPPQSPRRFTEISGCILRGSCRTYGKNAERIRECRVISSERQDHQVAPAPSASSTRTPWSMATATTSCGARRDRGARGRRMSPLVSAPGSQAAQLTPGGPPEATAKDDERQERSEDDDGIDALASLRRPVHVGEIKDERELIEHERGPNTEQDRANSRSSTCKVDHPGSEEDQ